MDQGALFTGGAGNDTFIATSAGTANAANTLNAADTLVGGSGTDVLNLIVSATDTNSLGSATISGIETINVRSATAGQTATLDAAAAIGATSVNANLGAGAVTVTNLATGAALGIIGNGTVANGTVTFGYATATAANTINLSGGTLVGTTIAASSATATTATINSTGVANVVGSTDLTTAGATMTTLTVNATTGLTATLVDADWVATGGALTVTGAGAVNLGTLGIFKTVDASANTGGLTMTVDNVATSFKGSSTAADTITSVLLTATTAGIVDAGAGTGDRLIVAAANNVNTAALAAQYTGFEIVQAGAFSLDASLFGAGVTAVEVSGASSAFTLMTATQAAAVTAVATATGGTFSLANAVGTADVLTVSLTNATAAAVATKINLTTATIDGFETLNVGVNSGIATAMTAAIAAATNHDLVTFTSASTLKTINVTGAFDFGVDLANAVKVTTLDMSGNTGGGSVVSISVQYFPPFSVQYFPFFQPADACLCAA